MSQSTHTTIVNGRSVEMYENSYQDDYTSCATNFMEKKEFLIHVVLYATLHVSTRVVANVARVKTFFRIFAHLQDV
jgi:hypothetical protein